MIKPQDRRGDVTVYDFRRPSRISPERQRLLDASHEQLAQALQGWVSGRLRAPFVVRLVETGQMGYGRFTSDLPTTGGYFIYDIVERPGAVALVSLDLPVAFVLIERLLGGNLGEVPPDRSLTPLERVVMRIVTDRIARELSSIWKDHVALECAWSRFESTPELIEMTGRDDDVLVATLQVELGELSGNIRLALPFPVLESFFNRGPVRRTPSESVSPAERIRERSVAEFLVREAATVVSARLPPARVPLRTLSGLRPGDVLPTGIPSGTGVEVHVSGTPRFTAREGRLGPWVGVEITAAWKPASRPGKTNRTTLEFSHDG